VRASEEDLKVSTGDFCCIQMRDNEEKREVESKRRRKNKEKREEDESCPVIIFSFLAIKIDCPR
jgi:hypothetical protein